MLDGTKKIERLNIEESGCTFVLSWFDFEESAADQPCEPTMASVSNGTDEIKSIQNQPERYLR